jgi:purine-nucleoside phosphorylase
MPYKDLSIEEIENWAGIKREEVPKYLIVDCAWPWDRSLRDVKKYIKHPKPIWKWKNPWVGEHPRIPVRLGYMIAFGSMAAHLYPFLKLNAKYVFQIGSIGGLQENIKIFDLIIPSECEKCDWLSWEFYKGKIVKCDKNLLNIIENSLKELKFERYHIGKTISVGSSYIETKERINKWVKAGLLGVEQETAVIYSVAKALGGKAIGLLRVINTQRKGERLYDSNRYDEKEMEKLKNFVRDVILLAIEKLETTSPNNLSQKNETNFKIL